MPYLAQATGLSPDTAVHYVVEVLLTVLLGLLAWVGNGAFRRLEKLESEQRLKADQKTHDDMRTELTRITTDLAVLKADKLSLRVDDHHDRLNALEHKIDRLAEGMAVVRSWVEERKGRRRDDGPASDETGKHRLPGKSSP